MKGAFASTIDAADPRLLPQAPASQPDLAAWRSLASRISAERAILEAIREPVPGVR